MNIIKHKNHVDIAFRVEKHWDFPDSSKIKFKGFWINIGYTELGGWKLPINDRKLEISKSKIGDWLICNDDDPNVLRNCTWRKLQL